jgi:uncharacterized metal-binding protein
MHLKSSNLAGMLSLIVFAFVGLSSVNSFADDTGSALDQVTKSVSLSCATAEKSPNASIVKREDGNTGLGQIVIAHGTWHPCANDPNACGAGHSCCSGHCVKGSCTGLR